MQLGFRLDLPPGAAPLRLAAGTAAAPVDAGLQPLFNEAMALAAGGGNVGGVKGGPFVHGAVDAVRAVAIRANRRDQQPQLADALAMHTLFIRLPVLGMTPGTAARLHLVVKKDRRLAVSDRQDVMRGGTVTLVARQWRSQAAVILLTRLGVNPSAEQFLLFRLVAAAAELQQAGWRLQHAKIAVGLMRFDLAHRGIAAVTILAAKPFLPMGVPGEILGRDEKPLLVLLRERGVALNAVVVVVGDVLDFGGLACGRVGCGRQRPPRGRRRVFHLGRAVGPARRQQRPQGHGRQQRCR